MTGMINIDGTWYSVPKEVLQRMDEYNQERTATHNSLMEVIGTAHAFMDAEKAYRETNNDSDFKRFVITRRKLTEALKLKVETIEVG